MAATSTFVVDRVYSHRTKRKNNECGQFHPYEGNYMSWQHCSVKHKVTMMKVKEESEGHWSSAHCLITML